MRSPDQHEKLKIVLISSIGHSGSTVLDLVLGAHRRCFGLGEIQKTLQPGVFDRWDYQPCSCGETVKNCSFWSDVLRHDREPIYENARVEYGNLAEAFRQHFGNQAILVDSSKGTLPYGSLAKLPDVEIRVIHLIRDVRSWATSQHRRLVETIAEHKNSSLQIRLRRRLARSYFMLFRERIKRNRQIESAIERNRWPALTIGYEQLALSPQKILSEICEFIGIQFHDDMLIPANSTSHIAAGNMMRSSVEKMESIRYDDRWFRNRKLDFPVAIMRGVVHWNDQKVSQNSGSTAWEKRGEWELHRPTISNSNDIGETR